MNVSSSIVHPEYNVKTLDNDIALWKLATPIEISSTIAYGKLPEKGSDPATDSIATVAGWYVSYRERTYLVRSKLWPHCLLDI